MYGMAKIVLKTIIIRKSLDLSLAVGGIAKHVREELGIKTEEFTPKRCGSIIGRTLKLKTERKTVGNSVPFVVIWDIQKIQRLIIKYGIDMKKR